MMSNQSKSNHMFENSDNRHENYWLDEAFVAAIEERAKVLEVTVDYYIAEFM